MVNLYKQFEELATRWKFRVKRDKFLLARIRLALIYVIPAIFFLVSLSYVLYYSLFGQLADSASATIVDPEIRDVVLSNSSDIIKNLIFLGDGALLFIVMFVGFFLTKKTLEPVQDMLEKQERFIADASHELRTPLTVMKTDIEVTLNQKGLTTKDFKTTLNSVLQEVDILAKLSNDLLNVSRGNLLNVNLDRVSIVEIISKVINRVSMMALDKNITLKFNHTTGTDKYVVGNESMLSQVFYNLIHNAIKYTPAKGVIDINFRMKNDRCIIDIIDNGIGIKEKDLDHIFESFYRADGSRTTPGSGLGLAIVKNYVELHSGRIGVKSAWEKGTTFTVTLPVV